MDGAYSLDLPPEIARMIISFVGLPVDQLRLISPTWNSLILSYLADRKNLPLLEFVHFHMESTQKPFHPQALSVKVKAHLSLENKDHFQGVFRGWHTDATFDRVESPFLHLRSFFVGQKVNENRQRLKKIFLRCSSIGNLYLTNVNGKMLDVILNVLGNVQVKILYVFKWHCNYSMRSQVLKIVRSHNVEEVTIAVERFQANNIGKFLRSVTQTANKVSILENMDENSEMVDEIFGRPRSFWEGKARKWSEDGSMKVEVLSGTKYWQGNRFVLEVSA
ncbi:hypothetical protein PRIPAC_75187 [Pristionchus pacificus]|uniref:Uncharacterized protein n=1 Tax=Pristionchus pacificus TaxID=54126 RepID=A0A2A6C0R1_PRIPA|nr:hypothetical protein PRIPAC_75187 [Pristionchus pacificus]|eukprot:PDM71677.1 hypothetical protein PRIPAC_38084 [Pristionchus pacificus]